MISTKGTTNDHQLPGRRRARPRWMGSPRIWPQLVRHAEPATAREERWMPVTDQKYMRPGLDFARGKAIEELGELQAALGKSLRWGWLSANPELPIDERVTNIRWVRDEMRDVRDALDNLDLELDKEF